MSMALTLVDFELQSAEFAVVSGMGANIAME